MTTKEYLRQLKTINHRIDNKVEAAMRLRSLAEKCTSTMSNEPRGTDFRGKDDIIVKAIMLEQEINQDIDGLIDLKAEIIRKIDLIQDDAYKILLTERYILGKTWEQIAVDMNYTFQHIHRLHGQALLEYGKAESNERD